MLRHVDGTGLAAADSILIRLMLSGLFKARVAIDRSSCSAKSINSWMFVGKNSRG